MAYRVEKQSNELVIDGWEKGIFPSPYLGIANIRNLNTTYYPGVAYVNYRRQQSTITANNWYAGTHSTNVSNNTGWVFTAPASATMDNPVSKAVSPAGLIYIQDNSGNIWKQTAVNASSYARLEGGAGRLGTGNAGIAYWNNYLVVFGGGLIEFCGDGSGDSGVISSNWNVHSFSSGEATNVTTFTTNFGSSATHIFPTTAFGRLPKFQVNDPVMFSTTGTLPSPLDPSVTYYILSIAADGSYMTVSTSVGGSAVTLSTDGTGTHTVTDTNNPVPLGNCTNLQVTGVTTVSGATSATISSYVNPSGVTISSGTWQEATGTYNIIIADGSSIFGVFTNGSATITFPTPLVYLSYAVSPVWQVNLLDTTVTNYRPQVSKVDGNLYYANGRYLGRILAQNVNAKFNPYLTSTYDVNFGTTSIVQPQDTITDWVDLTSTMIITGQKDVYTWNYISPTTTAPVPVGEPIKRITNILNNIYILAGQKGNIYISNGYSVQLFTKLPDYIAGAIDPVWTWGDITSHRSLLYCQALAQDTSGTNILAGTFSAIVSPPLLGEQATGLVMESQNSYGLTPAAGATANGLLIDNTPSSSGQDSYFSAWSNGASTGGIDYNDTSEWQNYEPVIETDIVPIGTILDKKTLGQVQFKLDRPMVSGDVLKLYARASLSDSYTLIGTTSTTQLSDYFPSNLSQSQWLQFKIAFKCASSGSSRIPLREIRVQLS